MDSLELTRKLHAKGVLTKEAALGVLRTRERLVKRALAAEADSFWRSLFALTKEAGLFQELVRGGKVHGSGFLSKMRQGHLTPARNPGAGWSDVGANLLKMLGVAGLSAAATTGASALLRHKRDRELKSEIANSYERMFEEYPRLREDNPDRVRTHFGVLARFAP